MALDCVNVHRGVELPRAEESSTVERVPGAVGGRAEGAGEHASAHAIVLVLVLLSGSIHVHLLLLRPLHIMDAHQETVVHDLQGGEELRKSTSNEYNTDVISQRTMMLLPSPGGGHWTNFPDVSCY